MSHVCHAHQCFRKVDPKLLFCYPHWKKLPKVAQDVIWREYRAGQEITKDPSARYVVAQGVAVIIVAAAEKQRDLGTLCKNWLARVALYAELGTLSPKDSFGLALEMDADRTVMITEEDHDMLTAFAEGCGLLRQERTKKLAEEFAGS
jgi:hypothetical protein